jgi:hypothetical protein
VDGATPASFAICLIVTLVELFAGIILFSLLDILSKVS